MQGHMLNSFFNFDARILAVAIMFIIYAILFTEKYNRAIVGILGAATMICFGILTEAEAIAGIDFNTIFLLIGMMIIVNIIEKSGFFHFMGIWVAKKVKANPRALLAILTLMTAALSGYVDNVTTVLLMTPIVIEITRKLKVSSFPFLMLMIFACNIGGAATLIGEPPNIMIGSRLKLTFMDFIVNMTPISYFIILVLVGAFDLIWGRKLYAAPCQKALVMSMNEWEHFKDIKLFNKTAIILLLVIIGFMIAHNIGLDTGTIAMIGAAIGLLMYTLHDKNHADTEDKVHNILGMVDWTTIFFFSSLFIIVKAVETTGILEQAGHMFVEMTDGVLMHMVFVFLWITAFMSSIIDNIPFTATMMPIVESIEQTFPSRTHVMPLWWGLLMGAGIGSNATIIASSANVVVAGIAFRHRSPIRFLRFMLWGIPVTIASMIIASIYIYLMYFI